MIWVSVLVLSLATVGLCRLEAKAAGRSHGVRDDLWVLYFAVGTYAGWCLLPVMIGAGITWVAG